MTSTARLQSARAALLDRSLPNSPEAERTILGAILLTGYLGGATATQVRLEDPWFFFPIVIGVLVWLGLYLRDERLRELVPLRSFPTSEDAVSLTR